MSRKLLLAALAFAALTSPAQAATRDILTVGNNWDGTASLVDPHGYTVLKQLNIVPDREARMAEIARDPAALAYFLAIRQLIGEGHDQLVDDAFTSPDGRLLYVSRPSFADVVAFRLDDGSIAWRTKVEGNRSDHMALSPDGARLLVSASTARKVHVLDTATGAVTGSFESGDQPHESNFSADGTLIYHASIGTVFTPLDDPLLDFTKGDRWFEIVDATTLQVLRRLDMGKKLAEAGYPNMSAAVRPMALAPDERTVFFQLSFLHGFVEYDLVDDKVLRVANLPKRTTARREQYTLDSAHHGLAMEPTGAHLCVAGTMDNYAAIVSTTTLTPRLVEGLDKPYWTTNDVSGEHCFVSISGEDAVAVISYATGEQVATIPVGDHPQRMRLGKIDESYLR